MNFHAQNQHWFSFFPLQILLLVILGWVGLTQAYYPYPILKHPSIKCDPETCLKCQEEFETPIYETNCHLKCGQCAYCSLIKAQGTEEEFVKCKNMCVEGIVGCTNTCLRLQDKCLACLPECEKKWIKNRTFIKKTIHNRK